jgi:hypothetical protein
MTEPIQVPAPTQTQPQTLAPRPVQVVVMDFDVGFFQMVWLMIKWAFAAIPALLIVSSMLGAVAFVFAALLAAMGLALRH